MTNQRSVLITGCSDGGIGGALAHAFQAKGFNVFATARDTSKMASLVNKPGVTLLRLDVTNDEHVAFALKEVEAHTGGKLHFLINNAARNHFMPMIDESIEDMKALFDTNVFGPLRAIKAFAPLIIAAKGTIVNVTSISGYINMPWMSSYSATKRSAEIMVEILRLELQPFGVRVMSLVAGAIATNGLSYFGNFKLPASSMYKSIEHIIKQRAHGSGRPKKVATPEEFAAEAVPKILGNQTGVVWGPGFTVTFVKFATSWLPSLITDSILWKGTGLDELSAHLAATRY